MSRKKLSILIYSLASGGAERVVSTLLNELKCKYNITLYLMNNTIFYEIPQEIKIVYLENSDSKESGIKKLVKLPILALKYKKLNISDVSLSFMNRPNYVNILAKLMGMKTKVIISERIAPSQEYKTHGVKDKISRWLIKFLYPKADKIIPNAIGIQKDLEQNFGIEIDKIVVINNPINLSKVNLLQNQFVEFRNEKFSFVTIGRIEAQKNHKLMVEAMKEVNANLYIIGDGKLRSELEYQIKENSLENKVVLLDRQSNPYTYLSQADCFVFTSNYEGFPNVLLEALACGLPVISTDCLSGPREILAPDSDVEFQLKDDIELSQYGILTPIRNVEKLIKAMNMIVNDEKIRYQYKIKAKHRASYFDVTLILSQFEEILDA
ncbi:glycosyltransferase [Arcobacter sp. KX21116]|uniref:glycosyltransferase n=1 Tax=Arcobacter iocasae TaxID=2906515 RepID=UPI0035D517A3